jgi:hypothetical protein
LNLDRFEQQLGSVEVRKPSLPLRRLALEARVLAKFVEWHWEPRRAGRVELPGLRGAAGAAGLTREVVEDLRDLATLLQSLDGELKATEVPSAPRPYADASRVLRELRATLRFVLGARPGKRHVLAKLEGMGRPRSASALALALQTHAALADENAAELLSLDTLAPELPERARRLALALREPRRDVAAARAREGKRRARDAVVTLLSDRMRTVRTVARFVFHEHPTIAMKATSDYERKRKHKSLRKRAAKAR